LWAALGFGFAEVGSVTARPSAGNPRPRAFRLPEDRALVNRMGLNNDGAEAVARRRAAEERPPGFVLGVNVANTHAPAIPGDGAEAVPRHLAAEERPPGFVLGVNAANAHAPAILGDAAVEDFRTSARLLLPHADFLVLNASCPNTAEGKTFEEPAPLDALLGAVMAEHAAQRSRAPVLVKLSPPRTPDDFGCTDELVAVARAHGVAGFVAGNTASDRAGLTTDAATLERIGRGGLS